MPEGEESAAEAPMGFAEGRSLRARGRRHDSERSLKTQTQRDNQEP